MRSAYVYVALAGGVPCASSLTRGLFSFGPFLPQTFANPLFYPFRVVRTMMAVQGTGCVVLPNDLHLRCVVAIPVELLADAVWLSLATSLLHCDSSILQECCAVFGPLAQLKADWLLFFVGM